MRGNDARRDGNVIDARMGRAIGGEDVEGRGPGRCYWKTDEESKRRQAARPFQKSDGTQRGRDDGDVEGGDRYGAPLAIRGGEEEGSGAAEGAGVVDFAGVYVGLGEGVSHGQRHAAIL